MLADDVHVTRPALSVSGNFSVTWTFAGAEKGVGYVLQIKTSVKLGRVLGGLLTGGTWSLQRLLKPLVHRPHVQHSEDLVEERKRMQQ